MYLALMGQSVGQSRSSCSSRNATVRGGRASAGALQAVADGLDVGAGLLADCLARGRQRLQGDGGRTISGIVQAWAPAMTPRPPSRRASCPRARSSPGRAGAPARGLPAVAVRVLDGPAHQWDEPVTWECWEELADDPIAVIVSGPGEQDEDLPAGVFDAHANHPIARFGLDEATRADLEALCELLPVTADEFVVRFGRERIGQAQALKAARASKHALQRADRRPGHRRPAGRRLHPRVPGRPASARRGGAEAARADRRAARRRGPAPRRGARR